jgi:hypothetical protein
MFSPSFFHFDQRPFQAHMPHLHSVPGPVYAIFPVCFVQQIDRAPKTGRLPRPKYAVNADGATEGTEDEAGEFYYLG